MISREDVLKEALHKCFVEMYRWAQPSIDLDELIKNGFKDNEKDPLYSRHYLSQDNFNYIRDTYMNADAGTIIPENDMFFNVLGNVECVVLLLKR